MSGREYYPLPPSHYEQDSVSCLGALRKPKEICASRDDYEECRKLDADIVEQRDRLQGKRCAHRSEL
jgi:hypothetical protein